MVTKSLPVIAVLSLMTSSVLTRADFTPKPNQKKLDHEINADFRGLPYQDKLEGKGSFVIKPIDKDAEIKNDWKKSQDGYSDEAAYKILIPPRESVAIVEHVFNLHPKTKGYIHVICMKNNNEECELMLEAFNSAHHVLYRAERVEVGVFQVEFLDKGDIYLRLTNNFNYPVKAMLAFDCIRCGKFNRKFLTRKDFKKKKDLISKINHDLTTLSWLTANAKQNTFELLNAVETTENWMLVYTVLEMLCLTLVFYWQFNYVKGLLNKKRMI